MNWKLPSHLEPYRKTIETMGFLTIEDVYEFGQEKKKLQYCVVLAQIDLLERLYYSGMLK